MSLGELATGVIMGGLLASVAGGCVLGYAGLGLLVLTGIIRRVGRCGN